MRVKKKTVYFEVVFIFRLATGQLGVLSSDALACRRRF